MLAAAAEPAGKRLRSTSPCDTPAALVLVLLSRRIPKSERRRRSVASVLERHIAYNIIACAGLHSAGRLSAVNTDIGRCIEYALRAAYRALLPELAQCCSLHFYKLFWQLSLQEVLSASHDRTALTVGDVLTILREVDPNAQGVWDTCRSPLPAFARDAKRLANLRLHSPADAAGRARLDAEKGDWFLAHHLGTTVVLARYLFFPRALMSYSDALFCAWLAKLLISLKTPRFQFFDFWNAWIDECRNCLRRCTVQEAKHLGIFAGEMMCHVQYLRNSRDTFENETLGNPCFNLNHYDDVHEGEERVTYDDCCNAHFKWEVRLLDGLHQSYVESCTSVVEKQIGLKRVLEFLSMACHGFPLLRRPTIAAMSLVSKIRLQAATQPDNDLLQMAGNVLKNLGQDRTLWPG